MLLNSPYLPKRSRPEVIMFPSHVSNFCSELRVDTQLDFVSCYWVFVLFTKRCFPGVGHVLVDEVDFLGAVVVFSVHIVRLHDAKHLSVVYVGLYQRFRLFFSGCDMFFFEIFHGIFGEFYYKNAEFLLQLGVMHSGRGETVVIFAKFP